MPGTPEGDMSRRIKKRLAEMERQRVKREQKQRRTAEKDAKRVKRSVLSALQARQKDLRAELRSAPESLRPSLEAQLAAVAAQITELRSGTPSSALPPSTLFEDAGIPTKPSLSVEPRQYERGVDLYEPAPEAPFSAIDVSWVEMRTEPEATPVVLSERIEPVAPESAPPVAKTHTADPQRDTSLDAPADLPVEQQVTQAATHAFIPAEKDLSASYEEVFRADDEAALLDTALTESPLSESPLSESPLSEPRGHELASPAESFTHVTSSESLSFDADDPLLDGPGGTLDARVRKSTTRQERQQRRRALIAERVQERERLDEEKRLLSQARSQERADAKAARRAAKQDRNAPGSKDASLAPPAPTGDGELDHSRQGSPTEPSRADAQLTAPGDAGYLPAPDVPTASENTGVLADLRKKRLSRRSERAAQRASRRQRRQERIAIRETERVQERERLEETKRLRAQERADAKAARETERVQERERLEETKRLRAQERADAKAAKIDQSETSPTTEPTAAPTATGVEEVADLVVESVAPADAGLTDRTQAPDDATPSSAANEDAPNFEPEEPAPLPAVAPAPESLTREELLAREAAARAERLAAEMDLVAARRQIEVERLRTDTERERADSAQVAATEAAEKLSVLEQRRALTEAKAAAKADLRRAKKDSRRLSIEARVRSGSATEEEMRELQTRIAAADARLLELAEDSGRRIAELQAELATARSRQAPMPAPTTEAPPEGLSTELEPVEQSPLDIPTAATQVQDSTDLIGEAPVTDEQHPVIDEVVVASTPDSEDDDPATWTVEPSLTTETFTDQDTASSNDAAATTYESTTEEPGTDHPVVDEPVLVAAPETALPAPSAMEPADEASRWVAPDSTESQESDRPGLLQSLREVRRSRTERRLQERADRQAARDLEEQRRQENREEFQRTREQQRAERAAEREADVADRQARRQQEIQDRILRREALEEERTQARAAREESRRLQREEQESRRRTRKNRRDEAIRGKVDEALELLATTEVPGDVVDVAEPQIEELLVVSPTDDVLIDTDDTSEGDSDGHVVEEYDSEESTGEELLVGNDVPGDAAVEVLPVDAGDPAAGRKPTRREQRAARRQELEDRRREEIRLRVDAAATPLVDAGASAPEQLQQDDSSTAVPGEDVLDTSSVVPAPPTSVVESVPVEAAPPLPQISVAEIRGSLLSEVPEPFQEQVRSWLEDLSAETLARITVDDIRSAVRVLADDEARDDLSHLQDVIRERPPVRITFVDAERRDTPRPELAVPGSAEPELRRDASRFGVFSKSGREERRDERAKKKIAREQLKLERARVQSERKSALREERARRQEEKDNEKIQRSLARAQGLSIGERIEQARMRRQMARSLRREFSEREQLRVKELRHAERALREEIKQAKRREGIEEKSRRTTGRLEERSLRRRRRDVLRDERALDRDDAAEFKEGSKSRAREEKRIEKARRRSAAAATREARKLEKARSAEEHAERKAQIEAEAALLQSESEKTKEQARSIKRLEKESERLNRIQEKARRRAGKADQKAQREADRERRREEARREMEAKAAASRERMLEKESSKITKRAARVEKLSRGGLPPTTPTLPAAGSRYDWSTESGLLGGGGVGTDIDPADFDLPEGLPSRSR